MMKKALYIAGMVLLLAGCGRSAVTQEDPVGLLQNEDAAGGDRSGYTALIDADATPEAVGLYHYLQDEYGQHILSGQYCDSGMRGLEMQAISRETDGIYPAVLGLDFIEYSPSRVAHGSSSKATQLAIDYWNEGGIVTFCWHWNAPEKYISGTWYSAFYTEHTNIDLKAIMNGDDPEGYDLLMEDIDAIAKQLLILQENGVPVLWRPLHEASGGWFWWGAAGPEAYKALYKLLYDKLTNEYGLHNLIWIWNGQGAAWYPGDEYVDIIGEDIYADKQDYDPQQFKFELAKSYSEADKMIVMSENGVMFDPGQAKEQACMWGFFCTWNGEFVRIDGNIARYSETYTSLDQLRKVYSSDIVITRDELPEWEEYIVK